MKLIKLKCENCGATLEVNKELDKINCNFCGAEILIDDEATELRRVEEVKLQSRKQNHEQTIKERKDLEELEEIEKFKKGKLSKFVIFFTIICFLSTYVSIQDGKILCVLIGILQIACFTTGWLSGRQIIKKKFKGMHIVLIVIGFALFFPFISINSNYDYPSSGHRTRPYECPKINLDDIYLNEQLFEVKNPTGYIYSNSKRDLKLQLCDVDIETYESYKEELDDKGYNIDVITDNSYSYDYWQAYNKEGYWIYLKWGNEKLNIEMEAPKKLSEINWPTIGLATKIPKPKSTLGKILDDNSEKFDAYIGNTTKEEFEDYIKACQDAGFVNNHSRNDRRYSASNNDNYEVSVAYVGYNTIYVSINAPVKDEPQDEPQNEPQNEPQETPQDEPQETPSTSNNELRSDFKNAMDSYEEFMDEYIAFMKKYNSNPSDYEMIKDYTNYLTKYSDVMDKFEKWEDDDLNDAEIEYYFEVQTRVNKKLTDATLAY